MGEFEVVAEESTIFFLECKFKLEEDNFGVVKNTGWPIMKSSSFETILKAVPTTWFYKGERKPWNWQVPRFKWMFWVEISNLLSASYQTQHEIADELYFSRKSLQSKHLTPRVCKHSLENRLLPMNTNWDNNEDLTTKIVLHLCQLMSPTQE